jgi:hypothetical protein
VIKDIALWLVLNRHFAGRGDVRLHECPSLEDGLRLAQVESPDLIVCRASDGEHSPLELEQLFRDGEIALQRVVCVHNPANGAKSQASTGVEISVCTTDEFLETAESVLNAGTECAGSGPVDLLANFENLSCQTGESKRGFLNLLELESSKLLLESNEPLQEGDTLSLIFFLPRGASPAGSTSRIEISLLCEIIRCRDEAKLHYSARVVSVKPKSQAPLARFVQDHTRRKEGL